MVWVFEPQEMKTVKTLLKIKVSNGGFHIDAIFGSPKNLSVRSS